MPSLRFEPGAFRLQTGGFNSRPLCQFISTILHSVYRFKDQMAFSSEDFEPVILTLKYCWIVLIENISSQAKQAHAKQAQAKQVPGKTGPGKTGSGKTGSGKTGPGKMTLAGDAGAEGFKLTIS